MAAVRSGAHFVRLPYPWEAIVDASSSSARAYLASLIGQALRYGIPTARRFGRVRGVVARRGFPPSLVGGPLRLLPRTRRPDLDAFQARLLEEWGGLDTSLPPPVPDGMLVLERAAARTIFVFAGSSHPAVVCKIPRGSPERIEREAAALARAAGTGIAPRFLGTAAGSWVQEGLAGAPLEVQPVDATAPSATEWPATLDVLCGRLADLAEASRAAPIEPVAPVRLIEAALSYLALTSRARSRVQEAVRAVDALEVGVLKHSDTSPQNCLFLDGRLTGIVDWELAEQSGAPTFDVLNAAVSYLEHGIGLVRWSERSVVDAFESGWSSSPFFTTARRAARAAAAAAGVGNDLYEPLEVAFFARRLGRRVVSDRFLTGPETAARIVEVVCAS